MKNHYASQRFYHIHTTGWWQHSPALVDVAKALITGVADATAQDLVWAWFWGAICSTVNGQAWLEEFCPDGHRVWVEPRAPNWGPSGGQAGDE